MRKRDRLHRQMTPFFSKQQKHYNEETRNSSYPAVRVKDECKTVYF
ncbi:hypothetical protein D2M30_1867 [Bacillus amyloliquefaciens]|nr:hypothetical protein D2M30_1867 [Bacillus amyloliquefaciens]